MLIKRFSILIHYNIVTVVTEDDVTVNETGLEFYYSIYEIQVYFIIITLIIRKFENEIVVCVFTQIIHFLIVAIGKLVSYTFGKLRIVRIEVLPPYSKVPKDLV